MAGPLPDATPEAASPDAAPVLPEPVVETPAVEVAAEAVVEAAPIEVVAAEPAAEPVAEETPAEEKPAEEAAAEEAAPEAVAEPAAEPEKPAEEAKPEIVKPVYEAFKLPENMSIAPEEFTEFTDVLGTHGVTQEAGQALMDLHAKSLQQAVEHLTQRQTDVFNETRKGWVADFDAQAGNQRDTILNNAKAAIDGLVKDPKKRAEVKHVLGFTGAGDHPAVINLLAAAGKKLNERAAPPAGLAANPKNDLSPAESRYGRASS